MKTTKVILFIITIGVLCGIAENVAVLPTNLQTNSLVLWLLNGTSLCTYLTLFVISFFLYKLINIYNKMHFFDKKSVILLRKIAFLVLILAILDILNRELFDILHNTHLSGNNILKNFFWRTLFVSPTFIFCSILIFILADFMEKAIIVKAENESFI